MEQGYNYDQVMARKIKMGKINFEKDDCVKIERTCCRRRGPRCRWSRYVPASSGPVLAFLVNVALGMDVLEVRD